MGVAGMYGGYDLTRLMQSLTSSVERMEPEVLRVRDRINIHRIGGVADVRLDRADKLNALDPDMFSALVETSDMLAKDTTLRAVVLSGEGSSFCAGLDFASFMAMGDASQTLDLTAIAEDRITHFAQQAVFGWTELPVPVIAAVEGHALGGGIQLALGADIRIVHPEARMSVLEIRWGIIPDMTGTQMLVDLVGVDVAKELTFTGRSVSGTEAKELGLATQVSETPRSDALELAHCDRLEVPSRHSSSETSSFRGSSIRSGHELRARTCRDLQTDQLTQSDRSGCCILRKARPRLRRPRCQ